jgi:GNAT superfamily N-acetyltransferase
MMHERDAERVKMRIAYQNTLPEKDQFFNLFESTGWNEKYQLAGEQLHQALQHSWYSISAYDGDRLVGFGRVISDGMLHALIVEMIVLPDYQGQGIGSRILNDLVTRCKSNGIRDIQLFCAKGKAGFYEKHGFVKRPADAPGMGIKWRSPEPDAKTHA